MGHVIANIKTLGRGVRIDFEATAVDIKMIISSIIEIPIEELDCDAHLVDDLGVDSLLALEVLAALEKRFGIEVPEEELVEFTTVNKIIEVARQKLTANPSSDGNEVQSPADMAQS